MAVAVLEFAPMTLRLNGHKMRELRTAMNLTQVEASGRAEMPVGRWNDLDTGRRTDLTVETLGNIAGALACESAALLIDDKPSRKKKG